MYINVKMSFVERQQKRIVKKVVNDIKTNINDSNRRYVVEILN